MRGQHALNYIAMRRAIEGRVTDTRRPDARFKPFQHTCTVCEARIRTRSSGTDDAVLGRGDERGRT